MSVFLTLLSVILFLVSWSLVPLKLGYGDFRKLEKKIEQKKITGLHIDSYDARTKKWTLISDTALNMDDSPIWFLENSKFLYLAPGQDQLDLQSTLAQLDVSKNNLKLFGGVKLKTHSGYRLKTKSMEFQNKKNTLGSTDLTHFNGQRGSLQFRSQQFKYNILKKKLDLMGDVQSIKTNLKNDKLKIRSQRASLDMKTHQMDFNSQASMLMNELYISAGQIRFQFSPVTSRIENVFMAGKVFGTDKVRTFTSEKLRADLINKKYLFSGAPRMSDSVNHVFGDEILYDQTLSKAQVSNAKAKTKSSELKRFDISF